MDGASVAKLITLAVLVALFVGAVLITPRIWHSNTEARTGREGDESKTAGRPS